MPMPLWDLLPEWADNQCQSRANCRGWHPALFRLVKATFFYRDVDHADFSHLMHSPDSFSTCSGNRDRSGRVVSRLLPVLIATTLLVVGLASLRDVGAEDVATASVVSATARIECVGAKPVRCQIEGGGTLLTVVSEGTRVRRGDVVARLDTSEIDTSIRVTRIVLSRAESVLEVARQDEVILDSKLVRETEAAELAVALARLDRQKYLEGEYKEETGRVGRDVKLAARRLELAHQRLDRARRLSDRGLLTPGQINGDKAAVSRAINRSEAAQRELKRLTSSRHRRRLLELDASLSEAAERLEQSAADARVAHRAHDAVISASRLDVEVARQKLEQLKSRRGQAVLAAASDGVVIYPGGLQRRPGLVLKKWDTVVLLAERLRPEIHVRLNVDSARRVRVGQLVSVHPGDVESPTFSAVVAGIQDVGTPSRVERNVRIPVPVLASAHWIGRPVTIRIDTSGNPSVSPVETQAVTNGTVEGHVVERGRVERADGMPVRSAMIGPAAVRRIAASGTMVRAGETLVEFDTEQVEAAVGAQAVAVARAQAELERQRRKLAGVRSTVRRNVAAARLAVDTAELDLEEYEEMTFVEARSVLDRKINGLVEDRRRASERLVWSRRVLKKGYITRSALEADRLAMSEVENRLQSARGRLELLVDHTRVRELKELKVGLVSARNELSRSRREGDALVGREMAGEKALAASLGYENEALAVLNARVKAGTIRAPRDGVVVACSVPDGPRADRSRLVTPGCVVHTGQSLLVLASTEGGPSNVRLTPGRADLVEAGQAARIRVGEQSRVELPGRVSTVKSAKAVTPGGDLRGEVVVSIGESRPKGTPMPMPGQTAIVRVRVKRDSVLRVPSRAVLEDGKGSFCYVRTPKGIKRQAIVSGLRSRDHVEVRSGVRRGDLVVTNPMRVDSVRLR